MMNPNVSETEALALTAYGCNKGQGFLYGHAMPFAALLDFARGAESEQTGLA